MQWFGAGGPTRAWSVRALWYLATLSVWIAVASPPAYPFAAPRFFPLTAADGLSNSHITAIVQDSVGFMWIATARGLNRYDGSSVRTYLHDPDDPNSIGDDVVRALHVDGEGRLWIGLDSGVDRYEAQTDSFEHLRPDPTDPRSLPRGPVVAIASDDSGFLWIATNLASVTEGDSYLSRLDTETGSVERFLVNQEEGSQLLAVYPGHEGSVFLGVGNIYQGGTGASHGMFRFDVRKETITRIRPQGGFSARDATDPVGVLWFAEDSAGDLWVSTWGGGVWLFRPRDLSFEPVLAGKGSEMRYVIRALVDDSAVWVVGNDSGRWISEEANTRVVRLDRSTGGVARITDATGAACGLSQYFIFSGYLSSQGQLWLGTSGGGVCTADSRAGAFQLFTEDDPPDLRLHSAFVRAVLKSRDGILWVATTGAVSRLDRNRSRVNHYQHLAGVTAMLEDQEGRLWLASPRRLLRVDPTSGAILRRIDFGGRASGQVGFSNIDSLHQEADGTIWLGTDVGLARFDPHRELFAVYPHRQLRSNSGVLAMADGANGNLWVGTRYSGLLLFDVKTESFKSYPLEGRSSAARTIYALVAPDAEGATSQLVWLATNNGLESYNLATNQVQRYSRENSGFPGDHAYGILRDESQHLWISTNRGLTRFDPELETFDSYSFDQGLQDVEFNDGAAYRAPDGEMFFGGPGGLNVFFPREVWTRHEPPPVLITSVRSMGAKETADEASWSKIHRSRTSNAEEVVLSYDQRRLEIEFVALDYTAPGRVTYSYSLEGQRSSYQDSGGQRSAVFSNLDPGQYTFQVRATSWDESRGEGHAELRIVVLQPWWQTTELYGAILLVVCGVIVGGVRLRTSAAARRESKLNAQVAVKTQQLSEALAKVAAQAEDLKELDRAKSEFVANITHEFRTPLTLMIGPLSELESDQNNELPAQIKSEIRLALDNSYRLLHLIDELLDASRLESAEHRLQLVPSDLALFLSELSARFEVSAARQGIDFELQLTSRPVWVCIDRTEMRKAVENLLSNSLKFTPKGGCISLKVSDCEDRGIVLLQFSDTGPGVSKADEQNIFDRFYVGLDSETAKRGGTGIGLALVKRVVELHGGQVRYRRVEGWGAVFEVELPCLEDAPPGAQVSEADRVLSLGRLKEEIRNT